MPKIPQDPALDASLPIVLEGYNYIWNRCRRYRSDLFRTRLLGQPVVCVHGPEAAAVFYDEQKLQRRQAIPRRVITSLFGKHAVHTLDDDAHRQRKSAFLQLMTPANVERLMALTSDAWRRAIRRWESAGRVVLFDEAARVFTEAVCAWAGLPLPTVDVKKRARDLTRMVDAFGGVGPRLWKGKRARARSERWITELVRDVRGGRLRGAPDTALHVMAQHRGLDGALMDEKTAAVEVLNVIRPTVANAWYVAFAALALHEHPDARFAIAREPVEGSAGEYADCFMQEVRRYYPFTPFLGAKVRADFEWRGHRFTPGTLVLLDVYGTHHDPSVWDAPEEFRPERFQRGTRGSSTSCRKAAAKPHAGIAAPASGSRCTTFPSRFTF